MTTSDKSSSPESSMSDRDLSQLYREANRPVKPTVQTDQTILLAAQRKAEILKKTAHQNVPFFGSSAFKGWSAAAVCSAICVSVWVVLQPPSSYENRVFDEVSIVPSPEAVLEGEVQESRLEEVVVTAAKSVDAVEPIPELADEDSMLGFNALPQSSAPATAPKDLLSKRRAVTAEVDATEPKRVIPQDLVRQTTAVLVEREESVQSSLRCPRLEDMEFESEIGRPSREAYVDYFTAAIERDDDKTIGRCLERFDLDYPNEHLPESLRDSLKRFRSPL